MLSVADAQSLVQQHARPLPPEVLPLGPELLGQVLAEDVASDLDMPPYDKALMDGYAVRSADLPQGKGVLTVNEEVTAGQVPQRSVEPGQATRIMTGAPLPAGADAVVIIERTQLRSSGQVEIDDRPLKPGANILYRGREMRRGETVLSVGAVLGPVEIGVLATVGRTAVSVQRRPRVAVLSTGDEVVEPGQMPGPGQIRNSNSPMLLAQAARAGAVPRYLGIARDRLDSLTPLIREGLQADVLVLSGGVSAGKLDLVPGVLQELDVTAHFHKVEMKPGKPVFFGTRGTSLVFGLPGNPVSSLVCFELFVRPALRRLLGHANAQPTIVPLLLAEDFAHRSERPTYFPARRELGAEGWRVRPVAWFGSADLRALCGTDVLLVLPAGPLQLRAGQPCSVLLCE
jgi:molybdopterin molybdotransferase